jgi:signal transduction histidine kinase
MRSIRLSLIVYFLVLLTLALGGVSWFMYQTTAQALRGKQASTNDLIRTQYGEQRDQIQKALDNHLNRQAQALAKNARPSKDYLEPLLACGILATPLQPQGYLNATWWWASSGGQLSLELFWKRPVDIVIKDADDRIPHADSSQAPEYFQTYSGRGKTQQHSENIGKRSFALDEAVRGSAKLRVPQFDTVEPEPGWRLRRVTLKWPPGRPLLLNSSLGFPIPRPPKGPGKRDFAPKGPPPGSILEPAFGPPPRPGNFEFPVVFVQYAVETSLMEHKLDELLGERDAKFAQMEAETQDTLAGLRFHILWISLAMFAGIVVGGLVLVRLGLAPLARLSEAVSEVSEKDFRLKIDAKALPRELQPIAARLSDTLDQLKRAFAREKQAAADISHELRTPLAAMMTTLELAVRKSRTAAEYREMLEDIRSSGAQMSHLVERLLALARLDAGAVQVRTREVDARDVARQCTNLIRPLAEARGLELRLHAPEPVPFKVDPDKLREILNNLLHNAVEYNRPQGAVDLNVSRVNGHLQLTVRDTGIGITPEQREHIFERFFRADPSRHADSPHAGLGLAIVKSYVDLMGGTIGVACGERGSTFTVELPVT